MRASIHARSSTAGGLIRLDWAR